MNFNSSIGYASNKTLDPASPEYAWIDHGKVIDFRNGGAGVNCIDPQIHVEENGRVMMFYGSYKSGLRVVELDAVTGKLKSENPPLITITSSLGEGVFILKTDDWYYIFASRGICCKGLESNYQMVMGRAKQLEGPYLNKEGKSWVDNNYSLFLAGDYEEPGRGHNGFFTENDKQYRGIFIISAKDKAEVNELLKADPAISENYLEAEIYGWYGSAALPEYLEASGKISKKSF